MAKNRIFIGNAFLLTLSEALGQSRSRRPNVHGGEDTDGVNYTFDS